MADQQELQKHYVQLQLLRQYAAAMMEEKGKVENKIAEAAVTMHAADSIGDAEKGQKFWAPLGSEVFMFSSVEDSKRLLVNVGANVYVLKGIEEAKGVLEAKRKEYEEINEKMAAEITELAKQIELLEEQLQQMAKDME